MIGTGYVGLVTGTCLAAKGHQVVCVDVDSEKVERINRGDPPIHEPGLSELLRRCIGDRLRATTDFRNAISESDISLVAVGTPTDGDGIDLRHVKEVAREAGRVLSDKPAYHSVFVKSTVVPGTTDEVLGPLLERYSGKTAGDDFGLGVNPEFLREGDAIRDFMEPDRIVMGGIDENSLSELDRIYEVFEGVPKIRTNNRTAEMIKYASNALLATLISYSNEMANLCSALGGIDVIDVMGGVHLDRRLSPILEDGRRMTPGVVSYLEAGCGFGGSCLPKDVKALVAHGEEAGSPMRLLDAVLAINREQPRELLRLLEKHFSSLHDVRVAVLGLAFKPGTDDVRNSPAIPVLKELVARRADVRAYDPLVGKVPWEPIDDGVLYLDELQDVIQDAEAIVIVTGWEEFKRLPHLLKGMNPSPLVIDGRRMLDKSRLGRYEGIGFSTDCGN